MKDKKGKTIAKEHLPSKVCIVCHRPFTWRKKWERNWDEVTTCSKSCNADRKARAKLQQRSGDDDGGDSAGTTEAMASGGAPLPILDEKVRRQQHKEAVKARKRERRLKRTGNAPGDVGRKVCDLCGTRVDLLIRCTVDATQHFQMVCGGCWPSISGGVPDGVAATHPHYRYGGLWKNRNANLKKKVGSGSGGKTLTASESKSMLLEEIEQSLLAQESEEVEL